jgi:hypothetical protein
MKSAGGLNGAAVGLDLIPCLAAVVLDPAT